MHRFNNADARRSRSECIESFSDSEPDSDSDSDSEEEGGWGGGGGGLFVGNIRQEIFLKVAEKQSTAPPTLASPSKIT